MTLRLIVILAALISLRCEAQTINSAPYLPLPVEPTDRLFMFRGSVPVYQTTAGSLASLISNQFNPLSYGASCGSSDSTAGLQAAVNDAIFHNGGTVIVPCVLTVAGRVDIGTGGMQGDIRISGTGPMYMPLQNVNPSGPAGGGSGTMVWPPTTGSAIVCTSTTAAACLMVNAAGVEIDHINFGNVQPTPPSTGLTWNPTFYPWIIGTQSNTGWQGINIHDVTFTSTSQAIDLEGTTDYSTWTGTQITLDHIWCNACLNTAVRIHNIDNQQLYSRFTFVPSGYYMSYPALGNYLRQNAVGFDIQYSAAPQFHDLNFFALKSAMQFRNGQVTNNFGSLVFAASAVEVTNVMFNNVCQAMTMPNGNGTFLNFAKLVNVDVWGDQSGFQCAKGKALFDFPTNLIDISMSDINVYNSDTFLNIGCGTPGAGSCPAGGPTASAKARIVNLDTLLGYGNWTAGSPLIKAPSNASIFLPGNVNLLAPTAGAGPVIGPGLDGTQAFAQQICVGGGPIPTEGAACLGGAGAGMNSGAVFFYDKTTAEDGFIGASTTQGLNVKSLTGKVFLDSTNGASSAVATFGADASNHNLVNLNPLPTTPPSGTGSGYICFDNAGNLYAKGSCP